MYDLLKLLNDRSAGDLAELDNNELQRFETLCENWRTLVESERTRRKSPPVQQRPPPTRHHELPPQSLNDRAPQRAAFSAVPLSHHPEIVLCVLVAILRFDDVPVQSFFTGER